MTTTIILATFDGGPLDGQPVASLDDLAVTDDPAAPDRVVYVAHPFVPGRGVAYYGDALAELAAPMVGQPDQHVYELAGTSPLDLDTVHVMRGAGAGEFTAALLGRYVYRGPFPKIDVPAGEGPRYVGPCTVACGHGCIVPPGATVTELLDSDIHEPEALAAALGCHCGRLFAADAPTPPATS